ncbi:MAG: beta-galactosidase trimerization domain-containing protein, partial [bacterium]|nr:beta-galactosidase trimerization domain-containing protein [bacterium]
IKKYVEKGGTFLLSVFSGIVNENDLVYECFPPYGLQEVFGLCVEETDVLTDEEYNPVMYKGRQYKALDYCDIVRNQDADVTAEYGDDFYKGTPVVTKHAWGKGTALYVASRMDEEFLYEFLSDVLKEAKIKRLCDSTFVPDVMIKEREKDGVSYRFIMNFSTKKRTVTIDDVDYELERYEYKVVQKR